MSDIAFVLGNGESRKGIKIEDLKKHGKVFACNAVFRTETPDYLVAVDPKMILEICETDYPKNHEVWSNYNNMLQKNEVAKTHVRWFQPTLGWSSGPTALKMAVERGHNPIYILGFDYQGKANPAYSSKFSFNNLYRDTRNYKRSNEEATFYGNWMNQTKRILQDHPKVEFIRVIPKNWFRPKDLDWKENLKTIIMTEFLELYKIKTNNS